MFDEDAFDIEAFSTDAFEFDVVLFVDTPSGGALLQLKGKRNHDHELVRLTINILNIIQ